MFFVKIYILLEALMECISYKEGYKYQLSNEYTIVTTIKPEENINTDYINLSNDGKITIKKGYAWDGPSGPTIDTLNFMRSSLVHDAFYQLMRQGLLDKNKFRKPADKLLQKMSKADGMSALRAWFVYNGVRIGADNSADMMNVKKRVLAPEGCEN